MDPMPGAIEAINRLADKFDVYILSTAPWDNPTAWSDKLNWVKQHLGNPFQFPDWNTVEEYLNLKV